MKIFFESPTYDLVTMDERANAETKLSVIGGTMGLFSGFSLISGVEIVYFMFRAIFNMFKHKPEKNKTDVKY